MAPPKDVIGFRAHHHRGLLFRTCLFQISKQYAHTVRSCNPIHFQRSSILSQNGFKSSVKSAKQPHGHPIKGAPQIRKMPFFDDFSNFLQRLRYRFGHQNTLKQSYLKGFKCNLRLKTDFQTLMRQLDGIYRASMGYCSNIKLS